MRPGLVHFFWTMVTPGDPSGSACREGNDHIIVIEDNGIGFKALPAKSDDETHIGIHNVRERLKEMCNGTMTIDSKPNDGTKVVLRIPVSEEMNR